MGKKKLERKERKKNGWHPVKIIIIIKYIKKINLTTNN